MGVDHRVCRLPPNSVFCSCRPYEPPVARGREVTITKLRVRHVKVSLGSSPQRARLHQLACDLEQVGHLGSLCHKHRYLRYHNVFICIVDEIAHMIPVIFRELPTPCEGVCVLRAIPLLADDVYAWKSGPNTRVKEKLKEHL